jgi:hypothetical protein
MANNRVITVNDTREPTICRATSGRKGAKYFAPRGKNRCQQQGDQKKETNGQDASERGDISPDKGPDASLLGRCHFPDRIQRIFKLDNNTNCREKQSADAKNGC